jgi:hypothetical protein
VRRTFHLQISRATGVQLLNNIAGQSAEKHFGGQWTPSVLLLNCFRTANLLAHYNLGTCAANRYQPCTGGNRVLAAGSRPQSGVLATSMDSSKGSQPPLVFGPYEADISSGELQKNGSRAKIQDLPLRLLGVLAENPGRAVTREELQKRLWPEDTFVDFEDGLNTAVKKLREALGDDAEKPMR